MLSAPQQPLPALWLSGSVGWLGGDSIGGIRSSVLHSPRAAIAISSDHDYVLLGMTPEPGADRGVAAPAGYAGAQQRLVVGGVWTAVAWGLSLLLGVPMTVLLVRLMSPASYGIFALATSVVALLAQVFSGGLSYSVSQRSASALAGDSRSAFHSVVRAGIRISVGAGIFIALGGALSVSLLIAVGRSHTLGLTIAVLLPLLILAPAQDSVLGITRAVFRPRLAFVGTSVGSAVLLLTTAIMLLAGVRSAVILAIPRSLAGMVTLAILAAGVSLGSMLRHPEGEQPTGKSPELVRLGLALMVSTTMTVCISQLGIVVLGAARGAIAVSRYAPVSKLSDGIASIFVLLGTYLVPTLTFAMRSGNNSDAPRLYHWASRWGVVACSAPLVALIATPSSLLSLFFGPRFAAMGGPARILGIGVLVSVLLGFNGMTLAAAGHARPLLRNAIIGLIVSAAACSILIPTIGATGAALSTSLPLVVSNVLITASLWRQSGILPWDRDSALVGIALVVAILAAAVTVSVFSLRGAGGLVLSLTLGVIATGATSMAVGGVDELRVVTGILRGPKLQSDVSM